MTSRRNDTGAAPAGSWPRLCKPGVSLVYPTRTFAGGMKTDVKKFLNLLADEKLEAEPVDLLLAFVDVLVAQNDAVGQAVVVLGIGPDAVLQGLFGQAEVLAGGDLELFDAGLDGKVHPNFRHQHALKVQTHNHGVLHSSSCGNLWVVKRGFPGS